MRTLLSIIGILALAELFWWSLLTSLAACETDRSLGGAYAVVWVAGAFALVFLVVLGSLPFLRR